MNRYIRFMENMLIKREGGHLRAYPLTTVRVTTNLGPGALVYATDDGYLGVQLDGEARIDEYAHEQVSR